MDQSKDEGEREARLEGLREQRQGRESSAVLCTPGSERSGGKIRDCGGTRDGSLESSAGGKGEQAKVDISITLPSHPKHCSKGNTWAAKGTLRSSLTLTREQKNPESRERAVRGQCVPTGRDCGSNVTSTFVGDDDLPLWAGHQ